MNEEFKKHWNDLTVKEKIGYLTSFVLIGSGILIAFLSFFLNAYNIATGVLLYIAQCFVIGGGLIGANVYFKSKWLEFNTNMQNKIRKEFEQYEQQRLEA